MKQKIIIARELSTSELEQIQLQKEIEIICLNDEKFPFETITIALSADEKKAINYSVLDELKNLGDKIIGGISFSEHLRIEKSSIWHYHKFRSYFFVRNLNYEQAKLSKIEFQDHEKAVFYCDSDFRFMEDEWPPLQFVYPKRKKQRLNIPLTLKYFFFLVSRVISGFFAWFGKSDILIYYPERYTPLLDIENLKQKQGNLMLDYFFRQSKVKLALLGDVPIPKLKSRNNFSFHSGYLKPSESGHPKKNMESLLACYGIPAYSEAKRAGKLLDSKYQELLSEPLQSNEKLTIRFVQSLHSLSVFYLWRYYAAKRFFRKNKFKTILAIDENSSLTKTVLDAAKFFGIKTIGMQHGTMHDLHPAYLYTKNEIKSGVIPDYTLVWGTSWEQFLIEKGNYPADSVISVGHLRTDIIPKLLMRQQGKNAAFKLVFASQPQRDPVLRKQAAFDVFSAAKLFPELELIVKLHPREFEDVNYYEAIAKEAGCANYRINKTTDLYEMIASCDALITCFSTVGTETVYFSKPLIILDHLIQDIQGYCKEGVAFQATNSRELADIISGLISGKLVINIQAYDMFINKYTYRIDGKVAERVSEFLNSL